MQTFHVASRFNIGKLYSTASAGKHVNYEVRDGVGLLKIDSPNSKVNTLNVETMTEMKESMDTLVKDANVKAIVLMSGILLYYLVESSFYKNTFL